MAESFALDTGEILWGILQCGEAGVADARPSSQKLSVTVKHLQEKALEFPVNWVSNETFKTYLWVVQALLKAGENPGSEAVQRLVKRYDRYKAKKAGWSYNVGGETYLYSTVLAMMNLHKCGMKEIEVDAAKRWILSSQNKDGGWGWFQGHLSNNMCTSLAIIGLKEVDGGNENTFRRARSWLASQQQQLKGYEGRWLITPEPAQGTGQPNALYVHFSTPFVLGSIVAAGENVSSKAVQNGLGYLLSLQDKEGGFPFERGFYWFKCPMSPVTWATGGALWGLGMVLAKY